MVASREVGQHISSLELILLENEIKIIMNNLTRQLLGMWAKGIGGDFQVKPQEVYQISKLAKFALRLIMSGGVR